MDWGLVIAVILIVLVGGSVVAVLWWRIAAGMAPYKDELAGKQAAPRGDVEEVVIRSKSGTGGSGLGGGGVGGGGAE